MVCIHGEADDDGKDDGLASDMWEPLHKIHGNVCLNRGWHHQRLKVARGVEVFSLVALVNRATLDVVADEACCLWAEEGSMEAV